VLTEQNQLPARVRHRLTLNQREITVELGGRHHFV
jgi:hypothetical protein